MPSKNMIQIVYMTELTRGFIQEYWSEPDAPLHELLLKGLLSQESLMPIFMDEDAEASVLENQYLVAAYETRRQELLRSPSHAGLCIEDYLHFSEIDAEEEEAFHNSLAKRSLFPSTDRQKRELLQAYFGDRIQWGKINQKVVASAQYFDHPVTALRSYRFHVQNFLVHVPRTMDSTTYQTAEENERGIVLGIICRDVKRPGKFKFNLEGLLGEHTLTASKFIAIFQTDLLIVTHDPEKDRFDPFLYDDYSHTDQEKTIRGVLQTLGLYAFFRFLKRQGATYPRGWHENFKTVWDSVIAGR